MTLKNFSPFHLACINYQACRHLFANCKWWLMPLHMSLQSGPIFQSHYDSLLSLWGSLSCVTTSVCFRLIGPVSILVFETPCPYTESQGEYDKTQHKRWYRSLKNSLKSSSTAQLDQIKLQKVYKWERTFVCSYERSLLTFSRKEAKEKTPSKSSAVQTMERPFLWYPEASNRRSIRPATHSTTFSMLGKRN